MTPKRRFQLLLLLSFVGLALAFMFPYRQLIEENIAAPLAPALHYMERLWRSLDGDMVWAFFILMVYLFILLAFPSARNAPPEPPEKTSARYENRLEFWRYQVRRLVNARELSRLSVVELRKLVLDIIAFREQLDTRQEAEQWLMTHQLGIPPELLALFDRGMPSRSPQAGGRGALTWLRIWHWKYPRPAQWPQSEEKLLAILQFLESQFENPYGYDYR